MSILRLSTILAVLLPTFWPAAVSVRSSTLLLARAHSLPSPNAGAPLTAWAASLAAQSAADTARVTTLTAAPPAKARPKSKGRSFVPIAPGRQILSIPNYVARARLGTPPQTLLVAIHPSNDATWIPCSACVGCGPKSTPSFAPTDSPTYRSVRCGSPGQDAAPGTCASCAFNLSYDRPRLEAVLGLDVLALEGGSAASSYTFGCLRLVTGRSMPPQGLLGFGRGPLSFLSQTKDTYGSVFSYCLPSYKSSNFSGTLRLCPAGQPRRIKTTQLLYNAHRPTLYYVDMVGIRVGGRAVAVPASALASFDPATGTRGTIVDAGTMFTRLSPPVYAAVRDAFRRKVQASVSAPLGGFDTCYNMTGGGLRVPSITIAFAGGAGAAVTLPEENVMIHSSWGGVACLAMAAGPSVGLTLVCSSS